MALPRAIAELDILCVREDGPRITIGPKGELAGFRQSDFLNELLLVQRWLENQTGIDEVLIDVENREYLRGRTLAGLVLLREHIPEGAEFGVCGKSGLLEAILKKMQAEDQVPVFPDSMSAFDHAAPSRSQILAARAKSTWDIWRKPVLLGSLGLLLVALLIGAAVFLQTPQTVQDYHVLLEIWNQAQQMRRDQPESSALKRYLEAAVVTVSNLRSAYQAIPVPTPQESQLYSAADALYQNVLISAGHTESETRFLRAMQLLATNYQLDQRPQPSKSTSIARRTSERD